MSGIGAHIGLGTPLAVPDPGIPGHCPGKILVNCAYFFVREFSCDVVAPLCVSPAWVTWQF